MRYQISEHINILPVPKHLKSAYQKTDDRFLIQDYLDDREFFINQTTKIFIEKFATPKTLNEVNAAIAVDVNTSADIVKKLIYPFFHYIKYRQFIVPENHLRKETKAGPLFSAATVLGQYKIENVISVNSSFDVYKATDLISERIVVIKLLKAPGVKEYDELKREVNFLQRLDLSDIAPHVYAFNKKEGCAYFVQDFIDGLSLPQFINRNKKSSLNRILAIAENILKAFATIHEAGIVHGDIHPSNIIVTADNQIKIIDFGLAINTALDKNQLVNFGGAYFFMPPERIKKTTYKKFTRKPDLYSDVFQLGVVLHMLLYDDYPFNGITWEELAIEIKEKPIEFPAASKYKFLVPGWLNQIVAKCVAKKPKQRFGDAKKLHSAFLKNSQDVRKARPAVKI